MSSISNTICSILLWRETAWPSPRADVPQRAYSRGMKWNIETMSEYMSKSPITVRGYVAAMPRAVDARQARVAVVQDDVEYRVMPRGAGVDLDDEVSLPVEATGLVEEADGFFYLTVRGYKVLEDDSWLEE